MSYPVYEMTATIAFVPFGNESMPYVLCSMGRTTGVCPVWSR